MPERSSALWPRLSAACRRPPAVHMGPSAPGHRGTAIGRAVGLAAGLLAAVLALAAEPARSQMPPPSGLPDIYLYRPLASMTRAQGPIQVVTAPGELSVLVRQGDPAVVEVYDQHDALDVLPEYRLGSFFGPVPRETVVCPRGGGADAGSRVLALPVAGTRTPALVQHTAQWLALFESATEHPLPGPGTEILRGLAAGVHEVDLLGVTGVPGQPKQGRLFLGRLTAAGLAVRPVDMPVALPVLTATGTRGHFYVAEEDVLHSIALAADGTAVVATMPLSDTVVSMVTTRLVSTVAQCPDHADVVVATADGRLRVLPCHGGSQPGPELEAEVPEWLLWVQNTLMAVGPASLDRPAGFFFYRSPGEDFYDRPYVWRVSVSPAGGELLWQRVVLYDLYVEMYAMGRFRTSEAGPWDWLVFDGRRVLFDMATLRCAADRSIVCDGPLGGYTDTHNAFDTASPAKPGKLHPSAGPPGQAGAPALPVNPAAKKASKAGRQPAAASEDKLPPGPPGGCPTKQPHEGSHAMQAAEAVSESARGLVPGPVNVTPPSRQARPTVGRRKMVPLVFQEWDPLPAATGNEPCAAKPASGRPPVPGRVTSQPRAQQQARWRAGAALTSAVFGAELLLALRWPIRRRRPGLTGRPGVPGRPAPMGRAKARKVLRRPLQSPAEVAKLVGVHGLLLDVPKGVHMASAGRVILAFGSCRATGLPQGERFVWRESPPGGGSLASGLGQCVVRVDGLLFVGAGQRVSCYGPGGRPGPEAGMSLVRAVTSRAHHSLKVVRTGALAVVLDAREVPLFLVLRGRVIWSRVWENADPWTEHPAEWPFAGVSASPERGLLVLKRALVEVAMSPGPGPASGAILLRHHAKHVTLAVSSAAPGVVLVRSSERQLLGVSHNGAFLSFVTPAASASVGRPAGRKSQFLSGLRVVGPETPRLRCEYLMHQGRLLVFLHAGLLLSFDFGHDGAGRSGPRPARGLVQGRVLVEGLSPECRFVPGPGPDAWALLNPAGRGPGVLLDLDGHVIQVCRPAATRACGALWVLVGPVSRA
ncbi:hypothetical protein H696_05992 [Fonticula alba]|uniref:Uncharacterized protein n=1 Tax=Fonticula alba TaxID=691883 RepID=A0A058Z0Z7_FONAL|nr:hypothetical protein H696_05992 [Fonticula alba]KCV67593.1 hypothetical protein H696_05992 [Fonticula alba]|eukprot:XP_009498034.1 hypothetical protein H696_05992 [Fonticula alba]